MSQRFVGGDGGYVRIHAPHLGSGLRRRRGLVGFAGTTWSVSRKRDVGHLKQALSTFIFLPPSFPFLFTLIPLLVVLSEAEGSRAEGLGVTGLCAADSSASLRMTLWEDVGRCASFDPARPSLQFIIVSRRARLMDNPKPRS